MYQQIGLLLGVLLFAGVVIMLLCWSRFGADDSMVAYNPDAANTFTVVKFLSGCSMCGSHASWHIDGPENVAPNVAYSTEEEALTIAVFLNVVYDMGLTDGKATRPASKDMEDYMRWKARGNGV